MPLNIADKLRSGFDADVQDLLELATSLADEKKVRLAMVGGAVRDMLLGLPVGDVDIMLEHPAKPIVAALAKELGVEMVSHERFFTFSLVLGDGKKIDVVTSR